MCELRLLELAFLLHFDLNPAEWILFSPLSVLGFPLETRELLELSGFWGSQEPHCVCTHLSDG